MKEATQHPTPPWRTPVLGPLARQAMRIDVGGQKRRKLLTLVAAFADAGIDDPSIRELSKRAGLDTRMTDQCLRRLAQQGFLTIEKFASDQRRNRYTLQLPSHS